MNRSLNILADAPERRFYHHAALNPWWIALLFLLAGAMVLYLYRAQRRVPQVPLPDAERVFEKGVYLGRGRVMREV